MIRRAAPAQMKRAATLGISDREGRDHWSFSGACNKHLWLFDMAYDHCDEPSNGRVRQAEHWTVRDTKAICKGCDVLDECRGWALDTNDPHGIWGALTPVERLKITKRRR